MGKPAISYVRFSAKPQEKGSSVTRQLEKSRRYAAEHGLDLDESYQDLGISAFKGRHTAQGKLGTILERAKNGTIANGTQLLVENLDRLSRQEVMTAMGQFAELITLGITIVLLPDYGNPEIFNQETIKSRPEQLYFVLGSMIRANQESQLKGTRVAAAWRKKREAARRGERMTQKLPYWISYTDGKKGFELRQERAAIVRRIFKMALNGKGSGAIEREFNAEGISPFASKGHWKKSYIERILTSRTTLGEYQPRSGGKDEGTPIRNHYPAAIDAQTFDAVQAARAKRRVDNGGNMPATKHMNLFSHICKCGHCGAPVYYVSKGNKNNWRYPLSVVFAVNVPTLNLSREMHR